MSYFDKSYIFLLNCKKYPNINFNESVSIEIRVFFQADGRTDRLMKRTVAFCNFVETSSKYLTWIKLTTKHLFLTLDQSRLDSNRIHICNFYFINNY